MTFWRSTRLCQSLVVASPMISGLSCRFPFFQKGGRPAGAIVLFGPAAAIAQSAFRLYATQAETPRCQAIGRFRGPIRRQ